jgi:hypothetical protein
MGAVLPGAMPGTGCAAALQHHSNKNAAAGIDSRPAWMVMSAPEKMSIRRADAYEPAGSSC